MMMRQSNLEQRTEERELPSHGLKGGAAATIGKHYPNDELGGRKPETDGFLSIGTMKTKRRKLITR